MMLKRSAPILAGFALLALAQDVVFRVTTTLVQIDAVVTDSKGRAVTDLTAGDFEVMEDGKARPVNYASYVRVTTAPVNTAVEEHKLRRRTAVSLEPPV